MAHNKFTAEQVAAKLELARRLEAQRVPVSQVCRELGVAELTYLRWHKRYAALDATAAARVTILEEENARLRRVVGGFGELIEDLRSELGEIANVAHLSSIPRPR